MLTIEMTFGVNRFHAGRWGQNPYEDPYGEWPPSPWRFLGALMKRWDQYANETGNMDSTVIFSLLGVLASKVPSFHVSPMATEGPRVIQSLPLRNGLRGGRTLGVDRFWVPNGPVHWFWDVELTMEQRALLEALVKRMTYFGRAESLCAIRVIEDAGVEPNCLLSRDPGMNSHKVLAWDTDGPLNLPVLLKATGDRVGGKKGNKALIPPGTMWYYARIPNAEPPLADVRPRMDCAPVNYIVFQVIGNVLPTMKHTLALAEQLRTRALKAYRRIKGYPDDAKDLNEEQRADMSLLSGHDRGGVPLKGHEHAFWFGMPGSDKKVSRMVAYRDAPFTGIEQDAIQNATTGPFWWGGGHWPVRLVPVNENDTWSGPSKNWVSVTPFVIPRGRHTMRNGATKGNEVPERVVAKMIQSRKGMHPIFVKVRSVDVVPVHTDGRRSHDSYPGFVFEVEFGEDVTGPLLVGDSCHFGNGLFLPV